MHTERNSAVLPMSQAGLADPYMICCGYVAALGPFGQKRGRVGGFSRLTGSPTWAIGLPAALRVAGHRT